MIKVSIAPYTSPYAYNDPTMCSDYMLDQVRTGLASLSDVQVKQYPENPFVFKECDRQLLKKLWGKGFSQYALLDYPSYDFPIEDSDLIIVALHHTMTYDQRGFYRFVKDIISTFKKKTVCVDGTDFSSYAIETADLVPYFKRELEDGPQKALPISFSLPEQKFCPSQPNRHEATRRYDFSPMIPANFNWNTPHTDFYHKWEKEEEYYEQYQQSYFGLNCKKGGWQTGRLLEIVANNSLPFFTDIERMPLNTWHNLPRELIISIKCLKGVFPNSIAPYDPSKDTYLGDTRNIKPVIGGWIDWDTFDIDGYYKILTELKDYFLKNMTTKSLGKYILEKSL